MVARTPDEVSQSIREKLKVTIPGLSLEVGTVERKLVDACAEAISEASVGQYVSGSQLDIETLAGSELEQFVGIFGFGRLQGRRATGIVRMELGTVATQPIQVNIGTQFTATNGTSPLTFSSTQAVVIPTGSYSVDIPVQCTLVGSVGNVPPGSINQLSSNVGSSSVRNLTAMSGGIDPETDDELRARFRNTFLRNIAGTEDFYKSLCLQNVNVSKVVVYGPTNVYRTQIEVGSGATPLQVSSSVKYVWPQSEAVFSQLGMVDEVFYEPSIDYVFTYAVPPTVTRTSEGSLDIGTFVDVEFEYTTASSRNDPVNGLTNKVDIFVNGIDPILVTEKTFVSSQQFSSSSSSELYVNNFYRMDTTTRPSTSNRFMRLGSTPLISFPQRITVNGVTYVQGVHFFVVRGTTQLAGSEREVAGLEWTSSGPASGTELVVSYTYNRTPELLNAQLKGVKQITTDVLVRQANYLFLKLILSVEYDRGYSVQQVNNNIQTALKSFFAQRTYNDWIEVSDFLTTVHQVQGVDNVWLTTQTEAHGRWGIETFTSSAATESLGVKTADFQLGDRELPIFLEAVIFRKANR